MINDGRSLVHGVTMASEWGEGVGARERWGMGGMKGEGGEVYLMFSP